MERAQKPPGVVVVGGHVNALGVVRALAPCGVPIAVVTTRPWDIAHRSRWTCEVAHCPGLHDDPDELIELLERRRADWTGRVLIPTNDEAVEVLAVHFDRLSRWCRPATLSWDVVRPLLRKREFHHIARGLGIDLPRSWGPATRGALQRADLRFPLLVKPSDSARFVQRFGVKLFPVDNPEQLVQSLERLAPTGLEAELVEMIPGGDDHVYECAVLLDASGRLVAHVTTRKLRQAPTGFGVARVAELFPVRELVEPTLEVLHRIGYRGLAAAEFKLDPRSGRFRMLEITPRVFLANSLARRAGVDLVRLLWQQAWSQVAGSAESNGWPGVWIHCAADLAHHLLYRRREQDRGRRFIAPYLRPKEFAVLSRRDPGPFLAQVGFALRTALRLSPGRARPRTPR